jgi:hypothetical protein
LTELLVASLDEEHEIARPWANEAERRYEELRSGAARPIPAKEVFNKRRPRRPLGKPDRAGSKWHPVWRLQRDENPNGIPAELVIHFSTLPIGAVLRARRVVAEDRSPPT